MTLPSDDEINSLMLRDALAYGITNLDLLEDKQWEISTRAWTKEIYHSVNPWDIEKNPDMYARRMVVVKSTQCGMSTMGIVRAFHFADFWKVRIFYTLPRQQDYLDFVSTRVEPMIAKSPRLSKKKGTPDSSHVKAIGSSYIFFMELTVEPRMMPADCLIVDEVDLSDPTNMSTAQNRLDASRWKLNYFYSTPTLPNFGIHALYQTSDMRQWMVKCSQCNEWQELDWEANLRVVGPQHEPTKVFYGCRKCNAELTLEHIQTGEWVAQKPNLTRESVGYHVSQMMTSRADVLYRHFRDPQTLLLEFYRKRLGMPYELGGGSLSREDFLISCFDEPYDIELAWNGIDNYYMGVDQGNELQVIVAKLPRGSRRPKVVYTELVPMVAGFDRVRKLIQLFHVRRCVIDGNPNRHAALSLQAEFPGRVVLADYVEGQRLLWKPTRDKDRKHIMSVTINRTAGFDNLMDKIRTGLWQLPGTPPAIPLEIELLIDHVTALKRDIESRRTASGETSVAVYRKLRADHLAHSWLYLQTAIELEHSAGGRMAIIGQKKEDEQEPEDANKPTNDIVLGIVFFLAEVPKVQLAEFLHKQDQEDYVMPFPLSYKIGKAKEAYPNMDDINWVIQKVMLKDFKDDVDFA